MSYQVYAPCPMLTPYVKHIAVSYSASVQNYRVLPDSALVIGFQFSGKLSFLDDEHEQQLAAYGVTGLLDGYRIFQNSADTGSVLVVFTETGAAQFIKTPLHELFGQSISLEQFFSRQEISLTREKLLAEQTDTGRIAVIEDFLLGQLTGRPKDILVEQALKLIHASGGTIRISKLAEELNTSQSPLEKRFRAVVGASPKKFAGIIRARRTLNALERNEQQWAELLLSYYDQAHFIKDFKKFSSLTPEQYMKTIRQKF